MGNPFVHIELATPDAAAAKNFYTELFGWAFTDQDMGGGMIYSVFKPSEGPGGGLMTAMPGQPTAWTNYVGVEDIHASTEKAISLGAKVMMNAHEIPHVGWFSMITDPTGAVIAMFQPHPSYKP